MTLNYAHFIDLGGVDRVDLNFERPSLEDSKSTPETPLFCAAARGSSQMMELVLMNEGLDIEHRDKMGVNAFWLACLYGHGHIMK
jgi:hypothetical protein